MTYATVAYASGAYASPEAAEVSAEANATTSVEIAFTSLPGASEPVWVDVSGYLQQGDTNRGKQNELDVFQAGTGSVRLDNRDRRFDPSHAAGPYFGYILPMRRIRIRTTYAGVTYPVIDGYIDRWTQGYDPPNNAYVTVEFTDGFKVLEASGLASGAFAQDVLTNDSPVQWYRLNEATGATHLRDSIGSRHLLVNSDAPTFGAQSQLVNDDNTAIELTALPQGALLTTASAITTGPLSVEMLYKGTAATSNLYAQSDLTRNWGFFLQVDTATGGANFSVWNGSAAADVVSTVDINDGALHHIVGVWEAAGQLHIYIDGVLRDDAATTLALAAFPATSAHVVGGSTGIAGGGVSAALGIYDEILVYNYALTAARIAEHNALVRTPWQEDLPGPRAEKILDAAEWPDNLRELDTGETELQSATLATSALEHLQNVAQSEGGELYMTRDGKVRLEARVNLVNQLNYGTYTDSATYRIVMPELSDQQIRNDVTVSRNDGAAQRVEDSTSIAAYLRRSYIREGLIHATDELSLGMAQWVLSQYKDPIQRILSLTITPRGNAATLFPQVLGRELTDRITVEVTPQGVGDVFSDDYVIQGIAHSFGPKQWQTTFWLSDGNGVDTCVFELDDGAGSAPCGLGNDETDGPALYF